MSPVSLLGCCTAAAAAAAADVIVLPTAAADSAETGVGRGSWTAVVAFVAVARAARRPVLLEGAEYPGVGAALGGGGPVRRYQRGRRPFARLLLAVGGGRVVVGVPGRRRRLRRRSLQLGLAMVLVLHTERNK